MKIAVAGTGYVGMSIATLLAQKNHVTAVDVIPEKVEKINKKISPIQDEYIEKYLAEKELDLTATLDGKVAYKDADFVVIAAPTNYDPQKNFFDTHHIEDVIDLVLSVNPDAVMVIKSTIPVGYCRSLYVKYALKFLTDPALKGKKFNLLFSPEFLRESKALYDNLYPSRIIVGYPKILPADRNRKWDEENAAITAIGDGIIKIEMHFLADIYVPCEVCHGKRYNRETLEVKYKGKNIYEVLDMTVEEAVKFFENVPSIRRKLETLNDVGLSYIKLGQPSTTLSGGEAQRIKLATELSKRSTGRTIYILDEPTTGLHFADVHKLTEILRRLAEGGNTVVVIEHNLDVIKTADYIIDVGPEGGARGGTIVACGTPEEIAENPNSYTGIYIRKFLERDK